MLPTRNKLPWRKIDDRAVVVQPGAGLVHELNPVGTFLWDRANGESSLEEMAQALSAEFEITCEQAHADAQEFFQELQAKGLIRWESSTI